MLVYFTTIRSYLTKFLISLEENIGKNPSNVSMMSKVKTITENVYIYKECVNDAYYNDALGIRTTFFIFNKLFFCN